MNHNPGCPCGLCDNLDRAFPPEPMSGMAEGAAAMRELWRTYVDAGFSEQQATYLIGQMLAAAWAKS